MDVVFDMSQVATQPQQQRARDRFEHILDEADALLLESGPTRFSIPELASRLGYTRASIYRYFPSPGAILNELVNRYLQLMEDDLKNHVGRLLHLPWSQVTEIVVKLAADFHNANPVGRMLILDVSTVGTEVFEKLPGRRLGKLTRWLIHQRGTELPFDPDICELAVEIGATCFRVSYLKHGNITPAYCQQAAKAMVAYLSTYLDHNKQKPALK